MALEGLKRFLLGEVKLIVSKLTEVPSHEECVKIINLPKNIEIISSYLSLRKEVIDAYTTTVTSLYLDYTLSSITNSESKITMIIFEHDYELKRIYFTLRR